MKVWLDDLRDAPDGWVRCYWPDEVITLMGTADVTDVSLDHDLGDDKRGTGYDVLRHLEAKLYEALDGGPMPHVPGGIQIHSANPVGRQRMSVALESVRKLEEHLRSWKQKEGREL